MSCQAMVGTPPVDITFSRSISCMAGSASQRRMSTILPPAFMVGPSVADRPVAWNIGTTSRVARCGSLCGSVSGRGSPARRKLRMALMPPAPMLEVMFRWVPSAPLGFPVVPEV